MTKKQISSIQLASSGAELSVNLPHINPEHAAYFAELIPDDYIEDLGHREYSLVSIKLDNKTFETVAVYELAVHDEYDDEAVVYTCEYRIRDNHPVRTDKKPIDMTVERYETTRKAAFERYGRR